MKKGKTFAGTTVYAGDPFMAVFELEPGLVRLVTKRGDTNATSTTNSMDGNTEGEDPQAEKKKTTKNATEKSSITGTVTTAEDEMHILQQFQTMLAASHSDVESLYDITWCTYFRIHRRCVPYYNKGNVFLAGDAAHIHSPMGGQGMNTGIQVGRCMMQFHFSSPPPRS